MTILHCRQGCTTLREENRCLHIHCSNFEIKTIFREYLRNIIYNIQLTLSACSQCGRWPACPAGSRGRPRPPTGLSRSRPGARLTSLRPPVAEGRLRPAAMRTYQRPLDVAVLRWCRRRRPLTARRQRWLVQQVLLRDPNEN